MMQKPSLTLRRRLKAAPARVYRAWTEPTQIMRWFGPEGAVPQSADTDVRVGGRYRMVFLTPNGESHDISGVYREVVADRRLVFTWAWRSTPERESLVTLDFTADGDGCVMTMTHEQFFDEAARDNHHKGWMGALDRFEAALA